MVENTEPSQASAATPKLNKALVAARKEISNPPLDSTNPFFKSKFASLKSVFDAVIPALTNHGISVHQDLREADGGMRCYTLLLHESGEEKEFGPLFFPCDQHTAQGYASASTYARRYHLQGVFCVVGDDDDDGNAASATAFTSVHARSKVRNALIKAATDGEDAEVQKIRTGMDNDQKAEMMGLLSKPQQKLIQEALHRLQEPTDDEVKDSE